MVTVEEYLHTSYETECEYVEGRLVDRHVGEYVHSRTQALVASELNGRERGFRTFIALRVRVSDAPRIRVPDVCVKAMPYKRAPVMVCPDLVVEILADDEDPMDFAEKIADYKAAGIGHVWVVDPYRRRLLVAEQGRVYRPATTTLSTPLVGEIDFARLFRELDD